MGDERGLSVQVRDAEESLVAGLTGLQMLVSSFTFQAPDFYKRNGYTEFARSEAMPTCGSADVHMVRAPK